MRFIDDKFRKNPEKYVYQSVLTTIFVFIVMYFIEIIDHPAVIASIGASAFILFSMPHQPIAKPRRLVGGYIVGMTVGLLFYYFGIHLVGGAHILSAQKTLRALLASISVGTAFFLMIVTDTEHPPAAGIALGIVFNAWNAVTLLYILVSAVSLACLKHLIKDFMIDLL